MPIRGRRNREEALRRQREENRLLAAERAQRILDRARNAERIRNEVQGIDQGQDIARRLWGLDVNDRIVNNEGILNQIEQAEDGEEIIIPVPLEANDRPYFNGGNRVFEDKNPYEEIVEDISNPEKEIKLYRNGQIAKIKDCVRTVCGKWFLKSDKAVVRDYFTDDYLYIDYAIPIATQFGEDGLPDTKIEAFTYDNKIADKCIYIHFKKGNNITTMWADVTRIPTKFYVESMINAEFYHLSFLPNKDLKYPKYRKVNAIKKSNKLNGELSLAEQYKYGIKTPTYNRTEGKRYSFGVELETIRGFLPKYLDKDLNYEAVHDGSLREGDNDVMGAEYVTGVLVGDTGLQQLKRLTNELTRRCKLDKKCGMHLHLANFDLSKQSIVLLYKLLMMVENEMFSILPPTRRNNEYCRNLKKIKLDFTKESFTSSEYKILIDKYYADILTFVSGGKSLSNQVNRKKEHPLGHKCGYNHASARYCWVNLVPTLFDTRGNGVYTVEFRSHSGTTSYEKIKMWLLICMGLLWFVENCSKDIALMNQISLSEIMLRAYPKYGEKINGYIRTRQEKFNTSNPILDLKNEELDYEEEVKDSSLNIKSL